MGFLHKLWDETLAGPTPDTGLAKLRKYNSFSGSRSQPPPPPQPHQHMACGHDDQVQVTRSITILKSTNPNPLARSFSIDVPGSEPVSPSCSTPRTPVTPGTPAEHFKRSWARTKSVGASSTERPEQRSPTVYDWIVISALDR